MYDNTYVKETINTNICSEESQQICHSGWKTQVQGDTGHFLTE